MEGVHLTSLTAYPVKSLGGVSLDAAVVEAQGLRGDRRWAVIDPDGTKVTAREEHALLGLRAEPLDGGGVRLLAADADPLEVEPPRDAAPVPVRFSGQDRARPAGPGADGWLTERVRRPLRLVWQDDGTHRPIRPDLGGAPGDRNSLSDAAPLHVTSESSLAQLNDWVVETALERGQEVPNPLGH